MNRAQRRAAEKKAGMYPASMPQNPLEYQLKLQIAAKLGEKRGGQKGFSDGVDNGVRLSMGIILLSLLDKCHIDPADIKSAWADILKMSDSVKRGYLSPDDIYNTLLTEYSVEI